MVMVLEMVLNESSEGREMWAVTADCRLLGVGIDCYQADN